MSTPTETGAQALADHLADATRRGYYGIGIQHGEYPVNTATLLRSAYAFDADFCFTIGKRYDGHPADTPATSAHVPVFHVATGDDVTDVVPPDAALVAVELDSDAQPLPAFHHPDRAVYVLGGEAAGVSDPVLAAADHTIGVPAAFALNVGVAGSIVCYDRIHDHGETTTTEFHVP